MAEMISTSDILVKDTELVAVTLDENQVMPMIEETLLMQEEVLKLKSIDQESLKMVVQL